MKKIILYAVLSYMSTIAVFAQSDKQTSDERKNAALLKEAKLAIEKGNAQWADGWKKRDAARVAALFAENGVQLSGTGKVIMGPKLIMERQKTAMQNADPGVVVTITTTNIWMVDGMAYETGKYKYEYKVKGKPDVDEGHYVTIWKKQKDSSWKLYMDMGIPKD